MANENGVKKYTIYYDLANDTSSGMDERFSEGLEACQSYDCDEFGIDWMQAMVVCSNYDRVAGIDQQFCFPLKYYVAMMQHFGARKNIRKARQTVKKDAGWNVTDSGSKKPDINDVSIG